MKTSKLILAKSTSILFCLYCLLLLLNYSATAQATTSVESTGVNEPITSELEYAADFSANNKAFQIFVEKLIRQKAVGGNYRLRLRYKAVSPPAKADNAMFVNQDGYVEVKTELVKLNDRESFVSSLITALQPIADSAKAGKQGLKSADAPFDPALANDTNRKQLEDELRDQFQSILISQQKLLGAPVAGLFRFVDAPSVYVKKYVKVKNPKKGYFRKDSVTKLVETPTPVVIDSIQMQIEDGNVFNVRVHAYLEQDQKKEYILFENYAPIGISTQRDLTNWHLMNLFSQRRKSSDRDKYMRLGEVIQYIPSLNDRTSDFSPVNGVYTIRPNDNRAKRTFYKTETEKLLQARIYSDLVGVDQDRPNGLIQVEVSKRFILNNNVSKRLRKIQHGFFYFAEPEITISKIEEKEKYLPLRLQGDGSENIDSVRSIDLMRYTSFRVGGTLNLGYFHVPNIKSMLLLNGRLDLNRVPSRDTVYASTSGTAPLLKVDENIHNVISYGLNLQLVLRPDARYGATFQTEWLRYVLTDKRLLQVPVAESRTIAGKFAEQAVLRHQISLWAKISANGELFFRTQFSHMRALPEQNFFQAQLGYQFDIFSTRRSAPLVKPLL